MSNPQQPLNASLRTPQADTAATGTPGDGVSAELWLAGTVLLAALAVLSLGALSWMV
jgi:hypothetical protein